MGTGAITGYIDVAQIVLYGFFAFFAGLIFYLRREDKREGYPLESERSAHITVQGFPAVPSPKTFLLPDGSTVQAPRDGGGADRRDIKAVPAGPWPGAPLIPTGDPMVDAVGPSAYAQRSDTPDLTYNGQPKLIPLRLAEEFHLDERDPDPRGMEVVGADGAVGGVVRDVWIDQSEYIIRYLEVEVGGTAKKRNVLLPTTLSRISGKSHQVKVNSILGEQFAKVPSHKKADVVTRLEEDCISAFYAGGNLYATAQRAEPLL
jgi:photosynthetic reaction center H subunit